MPTIQDREFGTIVLRRSAKASSIRIKVAPDGSLRVSLPLYTPTLFVRRMVHTSRGELRKLLHSHQQTLTVYRDGARVGKSHSIVVRPASHLKISRRAQHITVELPPDQTLDDPLVIGQLRDVVIDALRVEAKSYLPKRLAYLAERHGFSYQKTRFSHASGRWGSCSSSGTISLNIALMKLPFELIDYVLIHELCHTKQMNHGSTFWQLVEACDPDYRVHRRELKTEHPTI